MQGIKQRTCKLFYQFSLARHVPADHPYRKIEHALDLRFLYGRTRHLYGREGQQSIDPVVFFKMCLVGYLNNIASDRALVRYCEDSLAARWFIGYDLDEPLPAGSTLCRTRALFGESLYEQVFLEVLGLCVAKGMVSGKRQVVDSALVKANASLDSMQRKMILEDASSYCRQVQTENPGEPGPPGGCKDGDTPPGSPRPPLTPVADSGADKPRKRRRSNKTHRSTSDPDGRMTRKPGKPTALYYRGHISVDGAEGVIVAAMADYGDREDHQTLPCLLERIQTHLAGYSMSTDKLIADSKYNTLHSMEACSQTGMTAYMPNPSGYKRHRQGFLYDPVSDSYRCSQGISLPFKRMDKNRGKYANKVYQSTTADCAECPLREGCLPRKATRKTLYHSSGKALYDQMDERLQTPYGQYMLGKRKGIVEPVFGNLLWDYGMRKVYSRGKPAADKHVLMAAMAYNLKKWLNKPTGGPFGKAAAMSKDRPCNELPFFLHFMVVVSTNVKKITTGNGSSPLKRKGKLFFIVVVVQQTR